MFTAGTSGLGAPLGSYGPPKLYGLGLKIFGLAYTSPLLAMLLFSNVSFH